MPPAQAEQEIPALPHHRARSLDAPGLPAEVGDVGAMPGSGARDPLDAYFQPERDGARPDIAPLAAVTGAAVTGAAVGAQPRDATLDPSAFDERTLEGPAPAAQTLGPIRPDRLTVWPTENGYFGIDVRWQGRECILRAVVVRRLLSDAGYLAKAGNSVDGRTWELSVSPVPAGEVAKVIENYIW